MNTHYRDLTRCAVCGGLAFKGSSGVASPARPWLHVRRDDWIANPHQVAPVATTITTTTTQEGEEA